MYDPADIPAPALQPHDFDQLREAFALKGPDKAADWLCEKLETAGDYPALFYAILMRKRIELGVSPFPAGPASELPANVHDAYEEAIRDAGRKVGHLFLGKNDFGKAWTYFNMLGEPGPVLEALDKFTPGPDDDVQPIVEVCLYAGAYPEKGFDLVVDRYGICNAITTYSGQDFTKNPKAKQHCIRTLVKALHTQLAERLRSDIEGREGKAPTSDSVAELLLGRDELFDEHTYHIDTSHLSSVVQFSLELESGPELALASELALYGSKLHANFQFDADPPFDEPYLDYKRMLDILRGIDVEEGVKHFKAKIEPAMEEGHTFPAEIFVNLMLRLGRNGEALETAKKYLSTVEGRQMACPGVYELCLKAKDLPGMADAAKQRGDGVSYLAALAAG